MSVQKNKATLKQGSETGVNGVKTMLLGIALSLLGIAFSLNNIVAIVCGAGGLLLAVIGLLKGD